MINHIISTVPRTSRHQGLRTVRPRHFSAPRASRPWDMGATYMVACLPVIEWACNCCGSNTTFGSPLQTKRAVWDIFLLVCFVSVPRQDNICARCLFVFAV